MPEINLKYDGAFDIATGRHRKETKWVTREMTWSAFLKAIAVTHRTAESYREYLSSPRSRQDELKDVGGFVGGYIKGGRRKTENIIHRQLVTLDIDFPESDIWEDYLMLYGNAAAIYSTHKHCPQKPRLRLIIPLDRPVSEDEYTAISRHIAGSLGINCFDDTTYEVARLMYWPSTSHDGEYVFKYQDGPWFCADTVLSSYRDWRDSSQWPVSERVGELIKREIRKQGDPLEKPGIIGAFCREYDIHQAIETFLPDVYEPCDIENRYTYKGGSTTAGLIIYEDKYAYSHHGTDPAMGKLCNAFDLVRIHLFGARDEDATEGTPANRMPSYTAMTEMISKDERVRIRLGSEKIRESREDFEFAGGIGEADPDDNWVKLLDLDQKGNTRATVNNIRIILENDPLLKGALAKNEFSRKEIALRDLPWRKVDPPTQCLTDTDDAGIRDYLEKVYHITGMQKVKDAVDLTVDKFSFHPIKDYLNALVWDGTERIDTLLTDYFAAEDTPYHRAVMRKMLVGAVKRIFEPGSKFDYMLVLVGRQGIGKSTFLKKLGLEWFSDTFTLSMLSQGKEAYEQIQSAWIVEIGELAGLKKAEIESVKHFISKQEDRYRVAYGRRVEDFPRKCIFFGTTNNKAFLRDPTGNRRFWPVDAGEEQPAKSVFELSRAEVDQIWAEALTLYRAGEPLYLSAEIEQQAYYRQKAHSDRDDKAGKIELFLDTLLPADWDKRDLYERRKFLNPDTLGPKEVGTVRREKVCVAEIYCELFGRNPSDMTRGNTKEYHDIMKNMEGWKELEKGEGVTRFLQYGRQRTYVRDETDIF